MGGYRAVIGRCLLTCLATSSLAAAGAMKADVRATAAADRDAGIEYLLAMQNDDGGWGKPFSMPAMTALALKALVQHEKYDASSPAAARGYASLLKSVQPDGGLYNPKIGQANYTTSVAVMALAAGGRDRFKPVIDNAVKYLTGVQIADGAKTPAGETVTKAHPYYGGTSYGKHGRPDLSNLSFTIDALHEAGLPKDHPFFARAAVFLSRTQNRGESNDQPWAQVVNDGGFVYAPRKAGAVTGESKADVQVVAGRRGLRSYGSMTYAGFKSLLHANISRDDPRVRAALGWIRRHWRLDSNPNMPAKRSLQGLYYYYHIFAKALRAWGEDVIVDGRRIEHNWRAELVEVLHERRRPDGSWVNSEPRWYEDQPILVTCYAVLALEECLKR